MNAIFTRLAREVAEHGVAHSATEPLDAERYIVCDNQGKQALKSAKVVRIERVAGHGVLALFELDSAFVFTMPERFSLIDDEDVVERLSNAGLSALVFSNDKTDFAEFDVADLVDKVFGSRGEYSVDAIAKYFVPHCHFRARESLGLAAVSEAEVWSRCQSVYARAVVRNSHRSVWPDELKNIFDAVACGPARQYVGSSLVSLALAISPEHRFLEAYRAIEALLPVVLMERLHEASNSGSKAPNPESGLLSAVPARKLYDALEQALGWRLPQERALKTLMSRLPDDDKKIIGRDIDVTPDHIARAVFEARNQIAHGRLPPRRVKDGDGLLRAALRIVAAAYQNIQIPASWFEQDS